MSLLPFLAWLLGFSGLARAECPADVAHFRVHVEAAQAAYAGFDVPGFQQEAGELEAEVACLSGVPAPATIAQVHLIGALSALLDKDEPRMRASFLALRATDPAFKLSADLAPAGSQQRSVFEAAATSPASKPRPITRERLQVWVDGKPNARAVPTRRAAVVQVRGPSEELQSWYLQGGKLPADLLEVVTAPQAEPGSASIVEAEPAPRTSRPSRSMLLTGAAVGVASGVALFAATNARDAFYTVSPENAQAAYDTNRALGFTGYGLGAAALGLGVTAVVVGRW